MSQADNTKGEDDNEDADLERSMEYNLAREADRIYGFQPPLDVSKTEIRLLSLHNSDDMNAPLSGELHVSSMDQSYTALSYVWGDWFNRRRIRLNGVDTTITANLETILRQLRNERKAVNIWIDAVCINQTDHAEKGHQVQKMGDIYRFAKMGTILWLGEAGYNSDEAMDMISTASKAFFDDYNPQIASPALDGVRHLLRRDWWKRMWVIQETMLSPNAIVKVGEKEVRFEKFIHFRNLHWNAEQSDLERYRPLRNLWRECPFTPMLEYHYKDWIGGGLTTWMVDVAKFQCQHPRDQFYALLGLISRRTRDQVIVEYDSTIKSDRMVLLEATRLCFLETGLLPLQIQHVDKSNSLALPSWCPDWNSKAVFVPFIGFGFSPYHITSTFRPPAEKWIYGKHKDEKPKFMFSKDNEILFLHGFVVDIVDFVDGIATAETAEVPMYTGDDVKVGAQNRAKRLDATKKACVRWKNQVQNSKSNFYQHLKGDYEEAFCRTLVANRTYGKSELDYEVKPIFDAWIAQEATASDTADLQPPSQAQIKDYNNSVVSRCAKRTFITTKTGYFGLAPQTTKVGDLVCVVYGAEVAYILRSPEPDSADVPGSFVGEAYIHGIMQGEYLETAKSEDFTGFWLK